MSRAYRYIVLLVFVSTLFACNLFAPPAQAPQATATLGATDTAAPSATAALTDTPNPTDTVAPSDTPEPPATSTPAPGDAVTATFIANVTEMVGTEVAQLGPMAHMMGYMAFYSNPVGTPAQSWHDVPIMQQATAGQEFQADIYSYRANATLDEGIRFYNSQFKTLNWMCVQSNGSSGSGSNATHQATFLCQGFLMNVTAFDNDPKNILVVINKAP